MIEGLDSAVDKDPNTCRICGNHISVMIRTGSGLCGENCEKREKAKHGKG